MDPTKPFAHEGFVRNSEPASNSVGSLSHTDMIRTTNDPNNNNNNNNHNSLGSRSRSSTSFKDFMRSNDPNNNNNSSSTRSSYKSPAVAAAASLHNDSNYMDIRSDYFRQQSGPATEAAMFARASDSSGSASEPSHSYHNSYKEHNSDRHHYQSNPQQHAFLSHHAQNSYRLQPKDPPEYDSRPNLKNDQSDSYKPYSETNEASHPRDNYDTTSSNNNLKPEENQPKQAQHLETSLPESAAQQKSHGSSSIQHTKSAASLAKSTPTSRSEPRPYPRAGRPPASTTVPVCPKLPSRKLGRRGLLLGEKQQQRYSQRFSGEANAMSKRDVHDPGPLQGLSTTMTVECQGCGEIIKTVPKNAIALECPSCKKFYPTVTCRVLQ